MRNSLEADFLAASQKTSIMAASGLIADEWQERLITSKMNTICVCARQSGKSTATSALAAHEFYYNQESLTVIVAPIERQASELLRKIKGLLRNMPGGGGMVKDAATSIESRTGSRIIALAGTDTSTRGYTPNLLVFEECAFQEDETIKAVMPSVVVSKGRVVMISTPAGRVGQFYTTWEAAERAEREGKPQLWDRIHVTWETARHRYDEAFIESERQTRTQYDFQQEYEAAFLASDSAVLNPYSIDAAFIDGPPSVIIEGGIE